MSDTYTLHNCQMISPLIVSIPHAGTIIPEVLQSEFDERAIEGLPDTDWCLPQLYDFCHAIKVTMIQAQISRYVVDLNRDPSGAALYQDSRRQTDVIPRTRFDGVNLYKSEASLSEQNRAKRLNQYFYPYHLKLQELIEQALKQHRHILLFDAHSIRRSVPSLAADPFADLIVGDRDGTSAHPKLAHCLVKSLSDQALHVSYNEPFKGGFITKNYGHPAKGVHTLQLEMSQDLYWDEVQHRIDPIKGSRLQKILQQALEKLLLAIKEL